MSLASSLTGFVILDRSQNHQPWINAQRLSSYVEFWSPWQVFIAPFHSTQMENQ